jgi:hypothetical protein
MSALRAVAILAFCVGIAVAQDLRGTWSAADSGSRTFAGTWTAEVHAESGAVTGLWTLRDASGKLLMGGGWSANKAPKEWSGSWRATVAGSPREHSGSWTSSTALAPELTLKAMLEAALRGIVSGGWKSGGSSGSWSIRTIP